MDNLINQSSFQLFKTKNNAFQCFQMNAFEPRTQNYNISDHIQIVGEVRQLQPEP